MPTENKTACVLANNEAPEIQRAIDIVVLANEEQVRKILEILDR